jgi:hypothetical protein
MGVIFRTQDGKRGLLDVALFLREQGLLPYEAQDGNVYFKSEDGTKKGVFNVADWAVSNSYSIEKIDGFNTPITALDIPPGGMNQLDQAVFFMDGSNMDALRGIYPDAKQLDDGRVVVKDQDGLWKTMWSDNWSPPPRVPEYDEMVQNGDALDLKKGMRSGGIALLFGLAGIEPKLDKEGEITPKEVGKMLKVLKHNLPVEGRIMLSKVVEQTIGIDRWKFQSAMINPDDIDEWLTLIKKNTSFQIRQKESELAEVIVMGMHELATDEFIQFMGMLEKSPTTKSFLCNMKEPIAEFIQVLIQMDVISDMSKITGLDEWKSMAKDGVQEDKLPPMPDFVPKLVKLLQWVMPIYQRKELMLARGKQGLRSIISLMAMVDDAMFSLRNVPESSAKQKMFMVLKNLQAKLESKMSYYYHPMDDKTGVKVNEFMAVKAMYSEKREIVYKIVQIPKETWVSHLMQTLRELPNLEAFYNILPEGMNKLIQNFVALEIAYDMQPWIDSNYQERINDPFAMFTEEFGAPPPESGYLAKNSPRAALNIIETLSAMGGMLLAMPDLERRQLLRSPMLLGKALKNMQTASVQREVGAVEALSRGGLIHMDDPYASPDPTRIWEDPGVVEKDLHEQMMQQLQAIQAEEQARQQAQLQQGPQGQAGGQPAPGDNAPPIEGGEQATG